jgi:exo-beta-1,3-glucanase (GH17 family)
VVIAEIGWPSEGLSPWTTVDYEKSNYAVTRKWLATHPWNKGNTAFDAYWFEMFDEPWKYAPDAPWEPHFGLYTSGDNPQPKFQFAEELMA